MPPSTHHAHAPSRSPGRPVSRTIVRETIEEGDPREFVGSLGGGETLDADYVVGIDDAKDKVSDFIEQVNLKAEDGDVVFQLSQLGMGTSSPIATWTFSIGGDVQEMSELIVDRAVEDGSAIGRGLCKYTVTIEGKKGRKSFSLRFPDRDDDDIDEPANDRGALAQTMRQNEQLHRSVLGVVNFLMQTTQSIMKEQRLDLQSARSTQVEGIKMLGELYTASHERGLEVKRLEKSEARKDEMAESAMTLLQVVANKFMGQEVFAGKTTPIEQLGYRVLSSFSPDQWRALQTGTLPLRQDQVIGILEMAKALQDRLEAERKKGGEAGEPAPTTPNTPAPPAGGGATAAA